MYYLNTRKLKSATQDRGIKSSTCGLYPILSLMKSSDQNITACIFLSITETLLQNVLNQSTLLYTYPGKSPGEDQTTGSTIPVCY